MRPAVLAMLLACVALGVAGQLSLKHGVRIWSAASAGAVPPVWKALGQPYVLLGFGLYGASSLVWLAVLAQAPLSVAYPMLSLGYVGVALLSRLLFGEPLTATKLSGILLVCLGVALLAQGSR